MNTHLYPDIRETLETLKKAGCLLTVISNKPQQLNEKILTGLNVRSFFYENIGGGSFSLKTAPDALLYMMDKYNVPKENAWMAGDNHTVINAAGIRSMFCRFGFGVQENAIPSCSVNTFADLVPLLV